MPNPTLEISMLPTIETVREVRRHRGDGRAIYRMVERPISTMLYSGSVEWREQLRDQLRNINPGMRQAGKSAMLGAMYGYGVGLHENILQRYHDEFFTRPMKQKRIIRAPQMGPFTVKRAKGWTKNRQGLRVRKHQVQNKHGMRVHIGSPGSCEHMCEELNVKYAEWLMVKPDGLTLMWDMKTIEVINR